MWITDNGLMQERVIMPDTGLTKIVSVKVKGSGLKAEQEATKRLQDKIEHLADKRIKLSEAIDMFIRECEKTKKASTARRYRFELKAFYDVVGECYLDHLTAGYVRKALMDSGRSNRTLNGYLKVFKTFWMWAYRSDIVKGREVMDKLINFQDTPEKERIQDKYLESWELKKLLDNMDERWKLVSRFLVLSGCRIGELIALERCDVWGSVIKINKTYDSNNHVVTPPKSFDSKRDIHVQPELRECIEDIDRYVKDMKEKCGFESDLFFPDFNGGYLPYASYSKYLREVSERVLGKRCTPHIFRHTHTSFLAAAGVPLDTIANRLGHSDSKITKDIYFHRTQEMKEKENKLLDGISLIG